MIYSCKNIIFIKDNKLILCDDIFYYKYNPDKKFKCNNCGFKNVQSNKRLFS